MKSVGAEKQKLPTPGWHVTFFAWGAASMFLMSFDMLFSKNGSLANLTKFAYVNLGTFFLGIWAGVSYWIETKLKSGPRDIKGWLKRVLVASLITFVVVEILLRIEV